MARCGLSAHETDFWHFDTDIVHAINAALEVLQDRPAPSPFAAQEGVDQRRDFIPDFHAPLEARSDERL